MGIVNRFAARLVRLLCGLPAVMLAAVPVLVLALSAGPGRAVHAAEIVTRDGIDAVLIIDTSGSMREADRERTALEAAALFIDMMETHNSRVGVVEFNAALGRVIPLTPVAEAENREMLRSAILGFEYGGWTDIGAALYRAADMIVSEGDDANSPLIVLFTDGRIELGAGARTAEMSYADVERALEALSGETPVYTIGLNYDGSVDVAFLQRIASETRAHSFIVTEAAVLPQIFSEIFANHIRSSITEIAEFVMEEGEYTDVIIPIPSAFVAEANIIMLSESPLLDVRLISPAGQEAAFDGENYLLSYANRYSMIKLIRPEIGEWTLSVLGLPDERVTVNLIYNFDVNISLSVFQEEVAGPLLDPALPVTARANLLVADPRVEPHELFDGTEADLLVYNQQMQLLYTVPMENTGEYFTADYLTQTGDDVHLAVQVRHPEFETGSALITVSYSREPSEAAAVPEEPEDDAQVVPEQPEQPEQPTQDGGSFPWLVVVIVVLAAAGIGTAMFLRGKGGGYKFFVGFVEVRALLQNGSYTALETPDLTTFVGRTALKVFIENSVSKPKRILKQINLDEIYIQPAAHLNAPAIMLQNGGNNQITDEDEAVQPNKIVWTSGKKLFISNTKNKARLELTYRADAE